MRIRCLVLSSVLGLLFSRAFGVTFTINKGGTGDGHIRVNGVYQTLPFSGSYIAGTSLVIEAFPDAGSNFVSWTGSTHTFTDNPHTFSVPNFMIKYTANFELIPHTLTIHTRCGPGRIKVDGVEQVTPFSALYIAGTPIVIEALCDEGYHFNDWWKVGGGFSSELNPITFIMPAENTVCNFCCLFLLTVTNGGSGSGRIFITSRAPILFDDYGYHDLPHIKNQRLYDELYIREEPYPGSVFAGWSGAFNGMDMIITLVMDSDKSLVAYFNLMRTLTISKSGTGSGQVKVNNVARNLPYTEEAAEGTAFSLQAVPASGSVFSAWSGAVNSTNPSINVTLNSDKNLTAAFNQSQTQTKTVHITQSGLGTGWVKVNNILRQLPYSEQAASGTAFSLEAVPTTFSVFPGWSGAVTSTNPAINLTLDADKSLNAVFDLAPGYTNMLSNGEFSDGTNNWHLYVTPSLAAAVGSVQNGEYVVMYTLGGDPYNYWLVQFMQYGLLVEKSKTYHVLYDAHASAEKLIRPWVCKTSEPWTEYGGTHARVDTINSEKRRYHYSFAMDNPTDPNTRINFDIGGSSSALYLDNIVLIKEINTGTITFAVQVPGSTPAADKIYLAGNFNFWDPGPSQNGSDGQNHDLLMQKVSANTWQIALPFAAGIPLQYKYTRGSWSQVEKGPAGEELNNRQYTVPIGSAQKNDVVAKWADILTIAHPAAELVRDHRLLANYPNPFNARTTITFELPKQSKVKITIFDISGKEIFTLPQEMRSAGQHAIQWDAGAFPSGVYFCRLSATGTLGRSYQLTRKLMLMK